MDMVARQPRLLLQDPQGLPQRLQAVVDKLQTLHPSHLERVVAGGGLGNIQWVLVLCYKYYITDTLVLILC
jgi:hypothetical protein